jgi:hypothetical protein
VHALLRTLMSARASIVALRSLGTSWLSSVPSSAPHCAPAALRRAQLARPAATAVASPLLRPLDVKLPKSVDDLIPPVEARKAAPGSLRTGLIAIKVGVVSEWDEHGALTPFTVLWFDHNQV